METVPVFRVGADPAESDRIALAVARRLHNDQLLIKRAAAYDGRSYRFTFRDEVSYDEGRSALHRVLDAVGGPNWTAHLALPPNLP
jgi:hypothetical protein